MRHLVALIVLFVLGCSSTEEPPAKVEQALTPCPTPAYVHVVREITSITGVPEDPDVCPPVYYANEPRTWSLDLNAPPPNRADNKCSCRWISPGLCFNTVTNEGPSAAACFNGACNYYRAFECGYSTNCAHKVTYSMAPVASTSGSWNRATLRMIVTEPGCQRTVRLNEFNTLLP